MSFQITKVESIHLKVEFAHSDWDVIVIKRERDSEEQRKPFISYLIASLPPFYSFSRSISKYD